MFFEYSLPEQAPSYLDPARRDEFETTTARIEARMNLLENGLTLSGLSGEVFSIALSRVFSPEDETPALDTMAASDIAALAKALSVGLTAEPRLTWRNAVTVVDTAFVTRKEWETLRMMGIGGSDAAVVQEISPYRALQELYHDKCGTVFERPEEPNPGKDFIFTYGRRMEDLVIEQFCRQTGCQRIRETRMFRRKDLPFVAANIDAIVRFPDGRLAVFEAKTTSRFNKSAWENHSCPPHYEPQCRQYMAVLDDPRINEVYIGCIYGNAVSDFVVGRVPRDQKEEQILLEEECFFWEEYVEIGEEPPAGNSASKAASLLTKKIGLINPLSKDVAIPLQDDCVPALRQYLTLREQRRELERQVKALKEQEIGAYLPIAEAMGKNVRASLRLDGAAYEIRYAPTRQRQTDLQKLELAYSEAFADCVRVSDSAERRFEVKEQKKFE